jgi:choline monooxygenase
MGGRIDRASLERVLKPIAEASGLPNEFYTSEARFLEERTRLIGSTWAGLAFLDSIPTRLCVRPLEFMGLPLLLTRDQEGTLRVFHNVCSHRGMKLVADPTELTGLITCRYHCWSYTARGELKATPHLGGVGLHTAPGFDPRAHGLKEVRSAEFLGMLFINLSGDAAPFATHIAPLRERIERLTGAQGWSMVRPGLDGSQLSLEVRCNWKLAVENYCESYHLPWVHPSLNACSRLEDHYCFLDAPEFSGQGSLAYAPSRAREVPLPRLADWPPDQAHVAEYPSLYPNVLLGVHADHLFAILLTPLGPAATREELRIFYIGEGASAQEHAANRVDTLEAWRVVFAEDIFAVEGMQQGRASPGYRGGVFSPAMDGPTHHFHRWVAVRMLEDRAHEAVSSG